MPGSFRPKYSRGQRVEAQFRNGHKYYAGKISCVNRDGTYDIRYDDGDAEQDVEEQFIRDEFQRQERYGSDVFDKPSDTNSEDGFTSKRKSGFVFRKGQIVEARFKGGKAFYLGKIRAVKHDGYDIDYDDGDFEVNVKGELIRVPIREEGEKRSTRQDYRSSPRKSPRSGMKKLRSSLSPVGRHSKKNREELSNEDDGESDTGVFNVGDEVEARFGGKSIWYKGRIKRANRDGTYDVSYDDGDKETGVKASLIRDQNAGLKHAGSTRLQRPEKAKPIERNGRRATNKLFDKLCADKALKRSRFRNLRKELETFDIQGDGYVAVMNLTKVLKQLGFGTTLSECRDCCRVYSRSKDGKVDYIKLVKALQSYELRDGMESDESPRGRGSFSNSVSGQPTTRDVKQFNKLLKKYGSSGITSKSIQRCKAAFKREYGKRSVSLREFLVRMADFEFSWTRTQLRDLASCFLDPSSDMTSFQYLAFFEELEAFMDIESGKGAYEGMEEAFEVDDIVEARYSNGKEYYRGIITRVHGSGRYDIAYDDGDKEKRVSSELIKLLKKGRKTKQRKPTFRNKDVVEARFGGGSKYYGGKIRAVHPNGTYDIAYDDGDYEKEVQAEMIKLAGKAGRPLLDDESDSIGNPVRETRSPKSGRSVRSPRSPRSGRDKAVPTVQVGDKVMSPFQNGHKKYPGEVKKVNKDDTVNILFDDGDREKGIDISMVELIGKTSPRQSRLSRGDRVEARFHKGAKFYPGKIAKVNIDGTVDIEYDDGDFEENMSKQHVRMIGGRSSRRTTSRSPRFETQSGRRSPQRVSHVSGRRQKEDELSDGFSETDNREFKLGTQVEVKLFGSNIYKRAEIVKVNFNGTYNVRLSSGSVERSIRKSMLRVLEKKERFRSLRGSVETDLDEEPASIPLKVGAVVEARLNGGKKFYSGKISREYANDVYDVQYDNGDKERKVRRALIRALSTKITSSSESRMTAQLNVGDKVLSPFQQSRKKFAGEVRKVNREKGTANILFDAGDREKNVPVEVITKLESENEDNDQSRSDTDSSIFSEGNEVKDDHRRGNYQVGDRVEAKFKGKQTFYPGTVKRVSKQEVCLGTYDILYDDGDFEKQVTSKLIRAKVASQVIKVNTSVKVRMKSKTTLLHARVTKVNLDGTFDVVYEGGRRERSVDPIRVKGSAKEKTNRDRGGVTEEQHKSTKLSVKVGDKVLSPCVSRTKGKLYPATVRKLAKVARTVDLVFENGVKETGIPMKNLKTESKGRYKVGEEVEARYASGENYVKGVVVKYRPIDKLYDIEYLDGRKELKVKEYLMKPVRQKHDAQLRKKEKSRHRSAQSFSSEGSSEAVMSVGSTLSTRSGMEDREAEVEGPETFAKGEKVSFAVKDKRGKKKMIVGTIKRALRNGKYDILDKSKAIHSDVSKKLIDRLQKKAGKMKSGSDKEQAPKAGKSEAALGKERLVTHTSSSALSSLSSSTSFDSNFERLKLNLKPVTKSRKSETHVFDEATTTTATSAGLSSASSASMTDSKDGSLISSCTKLYKRLRKAGGNQKDSKCRRAFTKLDTEGSGLLSPASFEKALKLLQMTLDPSVMKQLISLYGKKHVADGRALRLMRYKKLLQAVSKNDKRSLSTDAFEADQDEAFFVGKPQGERSSRRKKAEKRLAEKVETEPELQSFKLQVRDVVENLRRSQINPNTVFQHFDIESRGSITLTGFPLALKKLGFRLNRGEVFDLWRHLSFRKNKSIEYRLFTKELIRIYKALETPAFLQGCPTSSVPQFNALRMGVQQTYALPQTAQGSFSFEDGDLLRGYNQLQSILTDALRNRLALDSSEVFHMFDVTRVGVICFNDFSVGLQRLGVCLQEEQVKKLMRLINTKNSIAVDLSRLEIDLQTFTRFLSSSSLIIPSKTGDLQNLFGNHLHRKGQENMESLQSLETLERDIRRQFLQICIEQHIDERELSNRFKRHDPNALGFITFKSVKRLFYELRVRISLDQLTGLFSRFSIPKRDKFNYPEFTNFVFLDEASVVLTEQKVAVFIQSLLSRVGSNIEEVFSFFAKKPNRAITFKEFKKTLASGNVNVSEKELKEVFRKLDMDKDGSLGLTEFKFAFNAVAEIKITSGAGHSAQGLSMLAARSQQTKPSMQRQQFGPEPVFENQGDQSVPQHQVEGRTGKVLRVSRDNSIGEWLETKANKAEKRNFYAFMNMLNSFDSKADRKEKKGKKGEQHKKVVENGEVVLRLGDNLKVAMRFVST